MAEPSSTFTGATAVIGASFTGLLVWAHPEAIWGAFIGALICVVAYTEINIKWKVVYLLLSWGSGYYAAIEAIERGVTKTEGAIACLAAAITLPLLLFLVDFIRHGELLKLTRSIARWKFKDRGREDDNA